MLIYGAVDDSDTMKKGDVEAVVRKLCVSYHLLRRSFKSKELKINDLVNKGEVTEAIQLMANVFKLPQGFVKRVGYSAKIFSPAALHSNFELFTTRLIDCTVYFRSSKAEMQRMCRYLMLHMVAHELAHARMRKDVHSFRTSEFATDVLAVLVIGSSKSYTEAMVNDYVQHGYIRRELLPEVFRCLNLYADNIYLR